METAASTILRRGRQKFAEVMAPTVQVAPEPTGPQPRQIDANGRVRVRALTSFTEGGSGMTVQTASVLTVIPELADRWISSNRAVEAPLDGQVERSIKKFGFPAAKARSFSTEVPTSKFLPRQIQGAR